MKPVSAITKSLLRLSPLFLVACSTLDTEDYRITHGTPEGRENGDTLLLQEIKSYDYALGIPKGILNKETPLNQQEVYADLILNYHVNDYEVDPEGSLAILKNTGLAGEDYNLTSYGDYAPQKQNYGSIGTAIRFDGDNDILSSENLIHSTYLTNDDGYTIIMSGQLIYKNTSDSQDTTPENILQIGNDSGTDSNRAPIVISQSASNDKRKIIGRSSGVGSSDNDDHYLDPHYGAFTIVHTGTPESGTTETIMITNQGITQLEKMVWYSPFESSSPDFIKHLSGDSSKITPLSPTNGTISLGGNPNDPSSRASIALKSLQVYNRQIDFNRIVLAASTSANEVGLSPRLLLASKLTEEYKNTDFFSTFQQLYPNWSESVLNSRAESAETTREDNLELYEANKAFLTDPIVECPEGENAPTADHCLDATLTTFGFLTVRATDYNNQSSEEGWDVSLKRLHGSFSTLMLSGDNIVTPGEDTPQQVSSWGNSVATGDPDANDKLTISARQVSPLNQPSFHYNTGTLEEVNLEPFTINNRQALYFNGVTDYMIVENLDETDTPPSQLATEGFIMSVVLQLSPIDYNNSHSKTIVRLGSEATDKRNYPIFDITTRGNNPCAIQIVHAGTQSADPLETNCYPVVLTYYSPPVDVTRTTSSGYTTYTSSGINAYINGKEVETNVASAWHKVNGANGITTPDMVMSIGANAHPEREPDKSHAAVKISHVGFWKKSDFEDADMEMTKTTAKQISRALTTIYGITARGLPTPQQMLFFSQDDPTPAPTEPQNN